MWILVTYILIVVIGTALTVGLGLVLDHTNPGLSLAVSIGLFCAVLWFGWQLAVRLTKHAH
jgi:hypothetical protein